MPYMPFAGGYEMKKVLLSASLPALVFAGFLSCAPSAASAAPVLQATQEICIPLFGCFVLGGGGGSGPRGAPGPIAGAGLPFLALGAGAYWLIQRRRKSA
jgi:hypothetical protein